MADTNARVSARRDANLVRHARNQMEQRHTSGSFVRGDISIEFRAFSQNHNLEFQRRLNINKMLQ